LPLEARIGGDLLVTGHRRGEDRLAERKPLSADGLAGEYGAVLENESRFHPCTTRPAAIVSVTRPWIRRPSSHEFRDSDRRRSARTRHEAFRSSSVRFADAPTAIRGRSRP